MIPLRAAFVALLPVLAVAAALGLSACGGDSDEISQQASIGPRALHARSSADAVSSTAKAPSLSGSRSFPSMAAYAAGVIRPNHVSQAVMDVAVFGAYTTWKEQYLRSSGGSGSWVKFDRTESTVSEAHGWGMVITALMGDKTAFDEMLRYFDAHPSVNAAHLMAWKQTLQGGKMVDIDGADSATDGDMDIAFALLLADRQWGASSAMEYRARALAVLGDILAHEVNPQSWNLTPGDWAHHGDANHTRTSDFMTSHLLAFAQADTANAEKWNKVYDAVVKIVGDQVADGSDDIGLMPDFMVLSKGRWVATHGLYLETRHDGDFSYNACRTPWRLAMAAIVLGRNELLPAQQAQAAWIRDQTGGVPTRIRAGYYVRNGSNGKPFVNYDDLAFTAPFAVNAMLGGSAAQGWLNALWTSITGGDYAPVVNYYGDTIRLQVMLIASGHWWQP